MAKNIQILPYPSYTTAQRNALTNVVIGYKIKNTTTSTYQMNDGTNWINIYPKGILYNDNQLGTLYYNDEYLVTGGQVSLSWKDRLLRDSTNLETFDWQNRILRDSNNDIVMNFNDGILMNLPTYLNNATAIAGGLSEGMLYQTPSREVKTVVDEYAGIRRYKALITQSGINAPTAIVLENTLGEVPTFEYNSTGIYSLKTTVDKFDAAKTLVSITERTNGIFTFIIVLSDVWIRIGTANVGGSYVDGALNKTSVTIEVYP